VPGAICKEHGVLEAICTKHNPALIAVFRAKGDFCEEHGFPESVCPICHPERGGKPSVDVSTEDGEAPADGTKIRFKTKNTAARAGIETVAAEREANGTGVIAIAKLTYDATKLGRVNPRSDGVVQEIKVDVGSRVAKGAQLAVIDSPEVGADRSRLQAARARVVIAEENHARQLALQQDGILSRKSLLAAEQELSSARSDLSVLGASLSVVGRESAGRTGASYALIAPLAGVVTQRSASIGQLVSTQAVLFEIVDTSTLWAELEIHERDLPSVATGQHVSLTIDGLEGEPLEGTLSYVAPSIDPHTRTVQARVPLPNPEGNLRANMFGQARIAVGASEASVVVPRAAVQRVKDVHLVFVRIQDDEYETRRVQVGQVLADKIELHKGVAVGEHVVTTGSFLLKTETLKESIGAGCCEVD
jgi:cobalt-zinc-cadmium efflux system membrane fusion protein